MTKARDIADLAATKTRLDTVGKSDGPLSNRNIVINGAMNVSQRHGTSSVQLSATEQYLTDRFFNDSGSSFNMSADAVQSSDAPSGFANSLKLSCDTVTTPTSSHNGCITTLIEGQDCQSFAFGTSDAKDLTLSFYAKSSSQNSGHTYGIMLGAYLNGTRNAQVKSFTVTDSWQRFTITFNGTGTATSTAINDNNANGMQISFSLAAGSSDQVSYSTWTADTGLKGFTGQDNFFDNTNNEFYLTGIQLEVGSQATPFEHRSYADELAKCQRYFARYNGNIEIIAQNYAGNSMDASVFLPTTMRAGPSVTTQDTSGNANKASVYQSGSYTHNIPAAKNSGRTRDNVILMRMTGTLSPAGTVDDAVQVQFDDFQADAEL